MTPTLVVTIITAYFLVLIGIAYFTSRNSGNDSFFTGERKSPWYLVSFGMIGASLSGVTFISVPGWVGDDLNQMSYMQMVFGYFFGYIVVAYVLMPIYYRLNVVSIYQYLEERFGKISYKTGAAFFLLSRIVGASVRLLLVARVLQSILFDAWNVPFPVTVIVAIALIWLYTNRGGIKTIVWTDTLQTAFMLLSVILTVWYISDVMDFQNGALAAISESNYSKIFFMDDINSSNHFLKHFLGGIFITIGMTGLDQDMMQKNLSCKNIKEAQKNMMSMATILVFVNFLFLGLGALLYMYADTFGVTAEKPDLLFSTIAMSSDTGNVLGILFLLGLIAAAYSSADSALTSLTTSFSVDFLGVGKEKEHMVGDDLLDKDKIKKVSNNPEQTRKLVHVGMSLVLVIVVLLLQYTTDDSAISLLMRLASYTYGPLIGIFFFGILTKRHLNDMVTPVIGVVSIVLTFIIATASANDWSFFAGYKIGFELIIINAMITFIGLFITSQKKHNEVTLS